MVSRGNHQEVKRINNNKPLPYEIEGNAVLISFALSQTYASTHRIKWKHLSKYDLRDSCICVHPLNNVIISNKINFSCLVDNNRFMALLFLVHPSRRQPVKPSHIYTKWLTINYFIYLSLFWYPSKRLFSVCNQNDHNLIKVLRIQQCFSTQFNKSL